jgi:DNA-binding NtrC family response regulator
MSKILIIEDDKAIVDVLRMILEHDGYTIDYALNGQNGIDKFRQVFPDVVLLDIKMPRMDGIEVLQELRKIDERSIIIMISGHGNIETAVQTTKLGAYDFISKPFDVDRLKLTIQNALNYQRLLDENENMKRLMITGENLIGESEAIKKLKDLIRKVASSSSRVLITGENGTGKEIVAKDIHRMSERKNEPFIHVNCATIPRDMMEIELFGSVKDYLPYTPVRREGKFEMAGSGTVFLDEISDLNLDAQSKLLYVLSENKIEPLGSTESILINARIISSTNKDLPKLIEEGKFREDLYHRINVLTVNVPPLRERKEDIPLFISYFSEQISKQQNISKKLITPDTIEFLSSLRWQGNVRELKNTIERMIILSDSEVINRKVLDEEEHKFNSEMDKLISSPISLHDFQSESEKIFIERKLPRTTGTFQKLQRF